MPSYETLDVIADAYTPLLALIALAVIVRQAFARHWRVSMLQLASILLGALFAYGLMYFDQAAGVWPSLGLDYSTHTAVATVLVVFLALHARTGMWVWIASLLLYGALMLYQRYHSLADILTTAVVILVLAVPTLTFLYRRSLRSIDAVLR